MGVDAHLTRLALQARKDFFGSDQVDLYGKGNARFVCHQESLIDSQTITPILAIYRLSLDRMPFLVCDAVHQRGFPHHFGWADKALA